MVVKVLPCNFFLKVLKVFTFLSMSLIHLKLIFVYGVKQGSSLMCFY